MPMNHGYTYPTHVASSENGAEVVSFLTRAFPHETAMEWQERCEKGEVTLSDGTPVMPGTPLKQGRSIFWHRPPWNEPEVTGDFRVIAEDEAIVAVDKPEGLPTLPGAGFLENTLLFRVTQKFPGATPMHRLGRGTTGVVLFARTEEARRKIQADWQLRRVKKLYLAVATGLTPLHEAIHIPIGPIPHPILGTVHGATPLGKSSHSDVTRLFPKTPCQTEHLVAPQVNSSVVQVAIETGRPHQIRIHLAAIGHPLVSDPLFVAGGHPAPNTTAVPGDLGYRLHAWHLSFRHPTTDKLVEITAPPPPKWDEFREVLPELWADSIHTATP